MQNVATKILNEIVHDFSFEHLVERTEVGGRGCTVFLSRWRDRNRLVWKKHVSGAQLKDRKDVHIILGYVGLRPSRGKKTKLDFLSFFFTVKLVTHSGGSNAETLYSWEGTISES